MISIKMNELPLNVAGLSYGGRDPVSNGLQIVAGSRRPVRSG